MVERGIFNARSLVTVAAVVVVDTAVWTSLPTIPWTPAPTPDAPPPPIDPAVTVTVALGRPGYIGIEVCPRAGACDVYINPRVAWRRRVVHLHPELVLVVMRTVPIAAASLAVIANTMSHQ